MKLRIPAAALPALLLLGACASSARPPLGEADLRTDVTGLVATTTEETLLIYERPGGAGLADYETFLLPPVEVRLPRLQNDSMADVAALSVRDHFGAAVRRELEDAGYRVVPGQVPDSAVLGLTMTLLDVGNPVGSDDSLGGFLMPMEESSVMIEATFLDAPSGVLEAVALMRYDKATTWGNQGAVGRWEDVRESLDLWARQFREALDEAHGR